MRDRGRFIKRREVNNIEEKEQNMELWQLTVVQQAVPLVLFTIIHVILYNLEGACELW